ncbi:hypothetical protein BKK41_16070 [Bacillus cereus]|nr:hypothetical protein BKK41_16070 [Bacillus cereus]
MNRVEVLEKVKGLLLLPNTEYATTKQLSKFYEVDKATLRKVLFDHREELESDGVQFKKFKEFKTLLNVTPNLSELTEYGVNRAGTNIFPRRAILRVGMLLRDSEVAKEVRTQLLNIEEKTTKEMQF